MKLLWCWRCKSEVPMLNGEESALVFSKYGTKGPGNLGERVDQFSGPVVREYERITGHHEPDPMEVWHHRLALYGNPCLNCGKPLRTPQAKLCAACGHPAT